MDPNKIDGLVHFCRSCGDHRLLNNAGYCSACKPPTVAISRLPGETSVPSTFDTAEELQAFLDKVMLDKNKK